MTHKISLAVTGKNQVTAANVADHLLPEIRNLIEEARHCAVSTANLSMVWLYWNIGQILAAKVVELSERADYGTMVVRRISAFLVREYGVGFSPVNLWDMRRFFEAFHIVQTPSEPFGQRSRVQTPSEASAARNIPSPASAELSATQISQPTHGGVTADTRLVIDFSRHFTLGWSHYRILLSQADPMHRRFYFDHAASQRWSVRELQRQIDGALFARVALSQNTRKLVAIEKRKGSTEIVRYGDAFKDPYLLDFLGLSGAYSEKDLESAIVANLQQFLIELGSDFCFIRRQYPMRIDDDDYFLDLLFYHRSLRALIAIELKIGAFTAADKGQMDLYLAWLKHHEWRDSENEPIGLILCTSKKKQHVEMLLAHGPHKMQVSEYITQLPDKKVLEERLRVYSRLLEKQASKNPTDTVFNIKSHRAPL